MIFFLFLLYHGDRVDPDMCTARRFDILLARIGKMDGFIVFWNIDMVWVT